MDMRTARRCIEVTASRKWLPALLLDGAAHFGLLAMKDVYKGLALL